MAERRNGGARGMCAIDCVWYECTNGLVVVVVAVSGGNARWWCWWLASVAVLVYGFK